MSGDSSDTKKPPIVRLLPALKSEWGVLGGIVVGFLALLAPPFLLGDIAAWLLAFVPISLNLKLSIVHSLFMAGAFGIAVAALAAYGKKLGYVGLNRPQWRYIGVALGGFAVYFLASIALAVLARTFTSIDYDQAQELGYQGLGGLELIGAFIPLVLLTPLAEEVVFRGFMFKGFRRRLPFWAAAAGVGVLFGLAHGQWNVGLDVFAMSIVSCYLVEKTNSLWPSIFLHVLKNSVAFYLLYLYNGG